MARAALYSLYNGLHYVSSVITIHTYDNLTSVAGRRCPPPTRSSEGGASPGGGGTNWLNNCQHSLKTRLKYIKTTLKVDLTKKNLALALREFFQRRPQNTGGGVATKFSANLPNTDFFCPTPLVKS